jgi:hypothetical protein
MIELELELELQDRTRTQAELVELERSGSVHAYTAMSHIPQFGDSNTPSAGDVDVSAGYAYL